MDIKPEDIESDELLDSDDDTVLEEELIKLIEQAKPLSLELPTNKRDREDDHDMPGIITDLRPMVKRCLHDILKPRHFKSDWHVKQDKVIANSKRINDKAKTEGTYKKKQYVKNVKTKDDNRIWHPNLGFIKSKPSKIVAYYNDLDDKPKARTLTRRQFKSLYSI